MKLEAASNFLYQLPYQLHFIPPGCGLIEFPAKKEALTNLQYQLAYQLHFTPAD
jgi:hypothetical protein